MSKVEDKVDEVIETNKPKILFIAFYDYGAFGIRSIQSFIKSKDYETYTIFFKEDLSNNILEPTDNEKELLFDKIHLFCPNIICISLRSPQFEVVSKINKLIKERFPGITVIWGGTHATICPEVCIEHVDYVCIGEGEYPLFEFIKEPSADIKNFWVRKDGQIVKNELRPLIQDLDAFPIPDYTDRCYIEYNKLIEEDPITKLSKYQIMASRGCPFRCSFCSNSYLHGLFKGKGNYIRRRSVNHVINELLNAKKTFKNIRVISFLDEVFTSDKEWLNEFIKEYKKINLPFRIELYPSMVDEENIKLLKNAGLSLVTMGIQCGSQRVRFEIFNRFTPDEQILKAANVFKKHKISANYDIILDNPYETPNDMEDGINMLLKLPRPYRLVLFSLNNFPKTELTQRMIADGTLTKYGTGVQGFGRWGMSLKSKRSKESLYYNCMVSLLSSNFIPKLMIRSLLKISFFKKHTESLIILSRISRELNVMIYGTRFILKGEVSFAMFRQYLRNFISKIRN